MVVELQTDPAVELEFVPEVVLARSHPRDPLAVPRRTKSVTAAHRRGRVPLLAAEDLAAVAETMRDPAAAEAAIAWAAAVVMAEVVAVEGAAVAADAGDRRNSRRGTRL